ncbi:MAG: acyl-CoA thioesterase [Puniceicoccales bacterium]
MPSANVLSRGGEGLFFEWMLTHSTDIRVRYAETDGMGIVYHANYFVWFEFCRVDLLDRLGFPYRDLEKRGYLLPVLEINASYKRSAYFDDRLDVTLFINEPPTLRMAIDYEVKRGGELLATGSSKHAFMSPEGRPIKPPRDVIERFAQEFA